MRLTETCLNLSPYLRIFFSNLPAVFMVFPRNRSIRIIAGLAMGSAVYVLGGQGYPQEADDVSKLIEVASQAETKAARAHLSKAVLLLGENKTLTRAQRTEVTRRLASVLKAKATSPADLAEILGPKAQKQIARQLLYRRYVEHWLVESPVRLRIVLTCVKGEEPVIQAIQVGVPP